MTKRGKELGLGRGLDSLLGGPETKLNAEGSLMVSISQIEPGLNQPRKRFEPEALADLSNSIRIHGIIQPLTVRRLASGYYQIIAGERRWRAAKMADLTELPVVVIEADDKKVMELGLIENLQRADLNPAEEAMGYKVLMQEYNMTQEKIAESIGKSRPSIANALRLLKLPEDLLAMLEEGMISAGHARTILALPSQDLQRKIADRISKEDLSVRQVELIVKNLMKQNPDKPSEKEESEFQFYLNEFTKKLSGQMGRKIKIHDRGKKGKIELEYYNHEDLEALLDFLENVTKGG